MAYSQKMVLFHDKCKGRNIKVDKNTVIWQENSWHDFASKQPFSKMRKENLHFQFTGNGRAAIGIVHVPDGSVELKLVCYHSINNNNGSGHGEICIFEDKIIIFINDKVKVYWDSKPILQSDHFLAVRIYFGNLNIEFSGLEAGNPFVPMSRLGKVTQGKILQLKTPNPGTFCVLREKWKCDFSLNLKIEPNTNVSYWALNMYVSNQYCQETPPPPTKICFVNKIENEQGLIILQCLKDERKVLCTINGSQVKTSVDNVSLDDNVYVWLEVDRCSVQVHEICNPQESDDSARLCADEGSWPSDQTFVKVCEPLQHYVNPAEVAFSSAEDEFIQELLHEKKTFYDSNSSHMAGFKYFEKCMKLQLDELQRNWDSDTDKLSLAKKLLERLYRTPHPLDTFILDLYSAIKSLKKCPESLLSYTEEGMRKKLKEIERDSYMYPIELIFAQRMLEKVFSTLHLESTL